MKQSTFMSIAAIVALIFGLSSLLMPVQTMSMYGVTLDVTGEYIGRYFGSGLLGIAVINWYARNGKPKDEEMRAIILVTFILTLTGFVASLFNAMYGVGNSLVWSTVIIYFLQAVGFGYLSFGKSAGS
jgi:hypothetical protein